MCCIPVTTKPEPAAPCKMRAQRLGAAGLQPQRPLIAANWARRLRAPLRTRVVANPAVLQEPAVMGEVMSWQAIQQAAPALDGFVMRPGSSPSTAPTSTLPTEMASLMQTTKPVVLIRDTSCWCPYCARVWLALEEKGIPYDSLLVNLNAKPIWYDRLVPTKKVPSISLNKGEEIVWESKDILLALEERFPDATPLLPEDAGLKTEALALVEEVEQVNLGVAGYAFLSAGSLFRAEERDASKLPELEAAFFDKLQWFEDALKRHADGPYLMGKQFTVADIMSISFMERLGATLPAMRGVDIRAHPSFPATAAWFAAIASRPAYQKVRSDDHTLQLLFGGNLPPAAQLLVPASAGSAAALEAADAIEAGGEKLVVDVLRRAGWERYRGSLFGNTVCIVNGYPPRMSLPVAAAGRQTLARIVATLRNEPAPPTIPLLAAATPGKENACGSAVAASVAALLASWPLGSSACQPGAESADALENVSEEGLSALKDACRAVLARTYGNVTIAPLGGLQPGCEAAKEAAAKVSANRAAIVRDILSTGGLAEHNASPWGVTAPAYNGYQPQTLPAISEAVEHHLLRLCSLLVSGEPGPAATSAPAAAAGAAAIAFFRNRTSSPRDMSASAAEQLRAACDVLLLDVYAEAECSLEAC